MNDITIDLAGELRASLITVERACPHHPSLKQSESPEHAALWWESIQLCSPIARHKHLRWLARHDLFFFLVYILNRRHFIETERKTQWTFERCWEVQQEPNNCLDIWGRAGYKSEIITFGLTLQDILNDPEQTFGLFSHTRPMAKDFLGLIKRECEMNQLLKSLFPDILWADPKIETRLLSVSWQAEEITFKRKGNPKEATIEAWGLVDGQPTGKRYRKLLYDDVVARDQIGLEMTQKTTIEFNNSLLLTASDPPIFRYVGVFQEFDDTTQKLIDRNIGTLRLRPAVTAEHTPAYMSDENFAWFKANLDTKTFALNLLLDHSKAKNEHDLGFREEWLEYYDELPPRRAMNIYGLVDPAGASNATHSYFALIIIGLCADQHFRVLDLTWDKYDLEERWQAIFAAQQKWQPLKWGYERHAMQCDIEHFKYRMNEINYRFTIVPVGNSHQTKDQRIGDLIPDFKQHRILLPRQLAKKLKSGVEMDLIKYFREREYLMWPYTVVKDILDALSRIKDPMLNLVFPRAYGNNQGWSSRDEQRTSFAGDMGGTTFMSE